MNNNKIVNVDGIQIEIAPWLAELMKSKTTTCKVNSPIIDEDYAEQEHCNHNPTDPIRSLNDVERLKEYFLSRKGHKRTNIRDYAYFVFSLNVARRAGDILSLHVYDVLNADGTFKTHVTFDHERKTGKKSIILLNSKARDALILYFNNLGEYRMSDWLFPNSKKPGEAMSVDGMRRMLQRAATKLNIDMHMGTHSLRKTTPYHMIKSSKDTHDETMVSQYLGHNNIKTTYCYIGESQTEMDKFVESHGI